ncbi:hypothetical protein LGQ02_14450 [Bacillus shivajii]|uniref:hypothetical protein n=1 Tax=Bacillus shivajii TaxID=1983719 RepID=UPI001CFA0DB9|nr:hypothetical protein [Bacillus shivajii]UCZ52043.1 hypothetical protein LGQ02_14450 [Bacillus shivajii]
MQWLYLFFATILGVVSLYHLFTHQRRKNTNDYVLFNLKDSKKISTSSTLYKFSVIFAYTVLFVNVFFYVEIFQSFERATILFMIVFVLGTTVLITLDKTFEVRGQALVFAGYHVQWGKIRSLKWGKKGSKRTKLIMELDKGTKIKTSIANEETDEVEELLSNYTYFEKK